MCFSIGRIIIITIPTKYINKDIYEVCALLKIKKYRKRTAVPNKLNPLELISIDIYGPLFNKINGSRYFLEIINNYIRKSDAILLKTKFQTISELSKWRKTAERYTKY